MISSNWEAEPSREVAGGAAVRARAREVALEKDRVHASGPELEGGREVVVSGADDDGAGAEVLLQRGAELGRAREPLVLDFHGHQQPD